MQLSFAFEKHDAVLWAMEEERNWNKNNFLELILVRRRKISVSTENEENDGV
jgi:hypothetical protein